MLNVANVLEGSVRRDRNRVRISARLIRADGGVNLWSDSYDRDLKDIFVVQDDIARAVASALQLTLQTGKPTATPPTPGITNPESYGAFLHARYFSHMNDKESATKAFVESAPFAARTQLATPPRFPHCTNRRFLS
jgi:hypothetical protein